ncbi:MAG TPA: AAA family ATPase [Candidatus Mediterraneibacter excrementigallinarum]|nr:AAA family ATPase [Candidatus Mediterraneibacter excrementigallinarum]
MHGYTQAQMAEKLKISRSTYTNYENGKRSPDLETLEEISDILDCTLDELFGKEKRAYDVTGRKRHNGYPEAVCEAEPPYHSSGQNSGKRSKRKLLIGAQDFRYLRERNAYYVDKTSFVEEFLDSWYQVTLVTRPRRFGKTLNMSMLAEFLDCTKESSAIFAGTKISKSEFMYEINQSPVVSLSFLNVRADAAHEMISQISTTLREEYTRYYPFISDGTVPDEQKKMFDQNYACFTQAGNIEEKAECLTHAITDLCRILEAYYSKKVYLLLDEYDTPFITANSKGYYSEVRGILSGMLSSALKGNPSLEKAMLTGIQRVAKENIFSGLNNLAVCTVADSEYEDCFGFTEEEVRELLEYCGADFTEEIREMYDGYRIGTAEVYNPWSVSCYAARRKLQPYWVNTSENSILKNALKERSETFCRDYNELIEHGTAEVNAELSTAYYENPDDACLWGLLINAGMLTIAEDVGDSRYRLRIPNQEVWKAFRELTAFYLQVEEGIIDTLLYHLCKGNMDRFAEEYQRLLLKLPSYHDLKSENSYHMMMLGMCAFLHQTHRVESNRESGTGRGDILLYSKKTDYPNFVLEFKYTKDPGKDLEKLALSAVHQAEEKQYDALMKGDVIYVGLAHRGKHAEIKWTKQKDKTVLET